MDPSWVATGVISVGFTEVMSSLFKVENFRVGKSTQ